MLTRSPATMPWSVAPRVTAASPVRTPARAWMSGPRARTASTSSRPARTARSASSSWAVGCAPDRHDRVADELLDRAAVAADDLAGELEVARQELPRVLGVASLGERREPDQVGEEDRDESTLGNGSRCSPPRAEHLGVRTGFDGHPPAGSRIHRRTWPSADSAYRSSDIRSRAVRRTRRRTCGRRRSAVPQLEQIIGADLASPEGSARVNSSGSRRRA